MAQYLSVLELDDLDGDNGFKMNGVSAGDRSGYSVASAGDVNGDGFADLIVGAYQANENGTSSGTSYLVFGKASGFSAEIELSSLAGSTGYRFVGDTSLYGAGFSVASAGDVNDDDVDDLIISAPFANPNGNDSGVAYVVYGGTANLDALDNLDSVEDGEIDLGFLDGDNGFKINGVTGGDSIGRSVASAGDINDDGFDDLIVGADQVDNNGAQSGASYIVFGASTFDAEFELSALDGDNGFRIDGEAAGDGAGDSVAAAGDVNSDGFADLIVGAPGAQNADSEDSGVSYVVFGKASGFGATLDVTSLDGNNGFRIDGEAEPDDSGCSVASGGDVNGDGYADLIVGANSADPNGTDSGASYVVFGKASGFGAEVDLADLDGNNGFKINGEAALDISGDSVASAGDFNGDGFDDLIIGARHADANGTDSGASYVVFGKASGFGATFNLSSLDGNNGFQINGEAAGDIAGHSVAAAGDVNDDGFADLIVGADFAAPNGTHSGASYVIFGGKPGEAVTRTGTDIANTIHGSDFNDTLSGQDGDDTLIGHSGVDTISGAGGKDTIYGDGGGDVLSGGNGKDTLTGGAGSDTLTGGAADDVLEGGSSADTFIFGGASDSTSNDYDTVKGADFAGSDLFDLTVTVAAIDATVSSGQLRKSQFDSDLGAAVGSGQLGVLHAVLFTPTSGNQSGKTFLIVDLNSSAGYQASEDLVIELTNSVNLGSLGTTDFI